MKRKKRAVVGIGSNLSDRVEDVQKGIGLLKRKIQEVRLEEDLYRPLLCAARWAKK